MGLEALDLPVVGLGHYEPPSGAEIDPSVWRECADLGWLSLGLAEQDGGVGYGLAEEAVLFRELGRGLAPGGFLPGVLAAHVCSYMYVRLSFAFVRAVR